MKNYLLLLLLFCFAGSLPAQNTSFIFRLTDESNGHIITEAEISLSETDGLNNRRLDLEEDGTFRLAAEAGKTYRLIIRTPFCFTYISARFDTGKLQAGINSVKMKPVFPGMVVRLDNIEFKLNGSEPSQESYGKLDDFFALLIDNPRLIVEIGAHTDSRGNNDYNLRLSQDRAQRIADYLHQAGVNRKRLIPRGYGEMYPINACIDGVKCSSREHLENRRIEYTVSGFLSLETTD